MLPSPVKAVAAVHPAVQLVHIGHYVLELASAAADVAPPEDHNIDESATDICHPCHTPQHLTCRHPVTASLVEFVALPPTPGSSPLTIRKICLARNRRVRFDFETST